MNEKDNDLDPTELPPTASSGPQPVGEARQIGPYRLLEKVGEGGMGQVWLAEQTRPVKRRVALKVIKQGMDTKQVVARFEAERQALAMMDHPAVAKVFDAGATPEGRPYFAMEYVKGIPITAHCDKNKLSNDERLKLFAQVCDGVQHAHQKAIIHRDLKPSNVLVAIQDGKAVPKIIDFGVAKATAQKLTEKTMFTQLGVLIGTPEYMSPEQAELTGQDVDTRTDVYSLGVMLYELVVGALPFDSKELRSAGFDGIRRRICEQDPPRPSTRLSTLGDKSTESARLRQVDLSTLQRQLRGDLDWITMKALEKDRTRRYGSPAELAADVERHLKHEPVLASPPSVVYRTRKFVRRHRVSVAASALVLAAMGLGLAGTTVGFLRAVEAKEESRREAAVANQVSGFLEALIRGSTPAVARGEEVTVREVLDRGAGMIEDELKDQPLVQARLMHVMGHAYHSLSLNDEAARLVEQALETRRDLLGNEHPDTLASAATLGEIYRCNARPAESLALKSEVYETTRRLHGLEHLSTLSAMSDLADCYIGGWGEKGQVLLEEMLPVARRVLGDDHPVTLGAIGSLGLEYLNRGRYEEAEALFLEQCEAYKRDPGPDHPETLVATYYLALLYVLVGRYEDAEPLCVRLVEQRRRIMGLDHHDTQSAIGLLGQLRTHQGRFDEAEELLEEGLASCEKSGRARHCMPGVETDLGFLYLRRGDYEKAERFLRSSYERRKTLVKGSEVANPWLAETAAMLASSLIRQGRFTEAERIHRELLESARRSYGAEHPATLLATDNLAYTLAYQGRFDEPETLFRKVLEVRHRKLGDRHDDLGRSYYNLACLFAMQSRVEEGLEQLREAARHGFTNAPQAAADPNLEGLRRDPRFEVILSEVRASRQD